VALASLLAWACCGGALPVQAEERTLDIERFRPSPGPGSLIGEERPVVLPHLGFWGGLLLHHAAEPLVFDSGSQGRVPVVSAHTGLDLGLACGLFGRSEVSLLLPTTLAMSGEAPPAGEAGGLPAGEGAGIGDVRLALKLLAVRGAGPFSLAFFLRGVAPTGDDDNYLGDGGFGAAVGASSALRFEHLELVANLGYRLRSVEPLPGTAIGDELLFGGGLAAQVVPALLSLRGELAGATGVTEEAFAGMHETTLEARLAAVTAPHPTVQILAGGGFPVLQGVGSPSWRIFASVAWSPQDADPDRDGLLAGQDRCPHEAEDPDGFQDEDGCPDPDNDGDGVPDISDRCPLEEEDRDKFQDDDGCPEEDNDSDGVPDLDDTCPDQPEDIDGFQDDDGCPDPDNDEDGVPDVKDNCPFEAEDRDGVEDEDGCPEGDDDDDGVPAGADRCPGEPETWNGRTDDDGCPDAQAGDPGVRFDGGRLRTTPAIAFRTGEQDLLPTSYPALEALASLLTRHARAPRVRLVGYALPGDARHERERRLIGEARAEVVRIFLLDAGVPEGKLEAVSGHGPLPAGQPPLLDRAPEEVLVLEVLPESP
jgi:outer membrane protein OmpA-like peptidoglycan-associated protein